MDIASQILEVVQQLLDEPLQIDMEQPLMTAGVSSVLAVQLTSCLESAFGMDLPGQQAFTDLHSGRRDVHSFQPTCCLISSISSPS